MNLRACVFTNCNMKAFGILAAAGLLSSAVAQPHVRRGGHAALHRRADQAESETCNCTSTVTVYSCTARKSIDSFKVF